MTYRHISQNDSEIMQEFAKIAKDKKLIREDTSLERAARLVRAEPKQTNLEPSNNLKADILRLCTGLREKGMVAEAGRLEERFRNLTAQDSEEREYVKQAQNYVRMYGTDGETGKALLEWAHPEGSPEMGEAEDKLGVVEDRLQQHKKIREIAERDPMGKLGSKAMVVAALKIILAQDAGKDGELKKKIDELIKQLVPQWKRVLLDPLKNYNNVQLPNDNNRTVGMYLEKLDDMNEVDQTTWGDLFMEEYTPFNMENRDRHQPKVLLDELNDQFQTAYRLMDLIQGDIDDRGGRDKGGQSPFDTKYPATFYGTINPFREKFLAIWNEAKGGDKWHEQFVSMDDFNTNVAIAKANIEKVVNRIEQRIIGEDEIKRQPNLLNWFQEIVSWSKEVEGALDKLLVEAGKYQEQFATINRAKQGRGLINGDTIRNLLTKIDKDVVSDPDIKTDTAQNFFDSIGKYYQVLMAQCQEAIGKAQFQDDSVKQELTQVFSGGHAPTTKEKS